MLAHLEKLGKPCLNLARTYDLRPCFAMAQKRLFQRDMHELCINCIAAMLHLRHYLP
jgi:hypothetical protein